VSGTERLTTVPICEQVSAACAAGTKRAARKAEKIAREAKVIVLEEGLKLEEMRTGWVL
jgi:hypothetical protein